MIVLIFDELFIEKKLSAPLSEEELYYYFEKYKSGDENAREIIIQHNITFVIYQVLHKFNNTTYDKKDLISVGLIGLIKSVDTFDISKNVQFVTYSRKCINNEILMFIRKNKKYMKVKSLDFTIRINDEGNEIPILDTISDIHSDFVLTLEDNEYHQAIRNIVEQLPELEKYIVMKYFGFIDNQSMNQHEIAKELGLSQPYVSKIIKKVLKNIKDKLEKLEIKEISIKEQSMKKKK